MMMPTNSTEGATCDMLEQVYKVFTSDPRFERNQLKNIYLFGSRLYGCAKPNADYDLIGIVDRSCPYFHGSIMIEHSPLPQDQARGTPTLIEVNLNLYHIDFFQGLLEKNMINSLMCLELPSQFIWKEEIKLPLLSEVLRVPALRKAILMDASHNLAKAKRLWGEGHIVRSKKNIVHGLRYLGYAMQLVTSGHITDFTAGNEYWKEVMENLSLDWRDYEDRYKPIYSSIMHDLRHNYGPESVDEEQNNSSVYCDSDTPDSTICTKELQTIKYISKLGLRALSKDFSLNIKQHSRYPELFHISPDPKSSPAETAVVQECAYGLIVEQRQHEDGKNVEYHVVAMSYTKITEASHPLLSS